MPPQPEQQTLGELLRQFRLSKGLTLEEIGALSELSHVAIGDWERGKNNPRKGNLEIVLSVIAGPEPNDKDRVQMDAIRMSAAGIVKPSGGEIERIPEDVEYMVARYSGLSDANKRFAQKMIEELERSERGEELEEEENPYPKRRKDSK